MAAHRTLYLFINSIVLIYFLGAALAANCPATTLPSAPTYPTATLSASLTPTVSASNPLTTGHSSETANLNQYRPPAATIVSNPAQTNCPHKQSNLKNWHDASTWPSGSVPQSGDVTIPAGTSVLISSCSISPSSLFGTITVPSTSALIFDDADISMNATGFNVQGSFSAGSETCRLRSKISITLHGKRGEKDATINWVKGIAVSGTIDIHGAQYFPTWTRLAMTAKPNDKYVFIQDIVNWQPGQRIVITTTELKDARDWHRNEERTIVSVKKTSLGGGSVCAIELDTPLSYQHFGGSEYQAEVSLLSRNIVIQGNAADSLPTDTDKYICTDPSDSSTYPCQDSYLTGFGAHLIIYGAGSKGRFSGLEMFRVGQTNVLGRYPIHFHMIGNVTDQNYQNHYIRDCAVHDSYFRCYAIHGTSGVKLTQNTAYNAIGHCYFLEDGVEENNEISYNQAAHIHALGPYQNPSIGGNGDNFWGQYLSYYTEGPNLLLPSDMSAGCFYITNTYNNIFGNAASGGWAGFAIPSLPFPVKLHQNIKNMVPANRPFSAPFRGNSAHSSGYWWLSAGAIYVGGELTHRASDGLLQYTAGRSTSRDTCSDPTRGSTPGDGCWDRTQQLWLDFNDNKVFLSNRGMQNWGNRANIVRLELHDVSLAMNIFGKVWIDNMLMECRSANNRFTFFSGCPKPPTEGGTDWGNCNVRDYTFWRTFGGFQWYDVGQQHILTDSTFRNCRADWERCSSGSSHVCSDMAVFTSLSHSDQFVPELMQVSSGIKYENVGDLWRYSTKLTDNTGVTVSGRLQSWYDPDGSASQTGVRTMIGSAWANTWWKYNNNCQYYLQAYKCPLQAGDSAASVVLRRYNTDENNIGNTLCLNGGGGKPCPVIGQISHFGSTNETTGLAMAVNAKLTGPLIASSGGWFIRYTAGTPKTLTFTSVQVAMEDNFLVALPYPSGTKFTIYHKAATWCGTSWAYCRKDFIPVSSVAAVRAAFGDAYYWNENTKTLYLRLVQSTETWGNPYDKNYNNSAPWKPTQPQEQFTRGGHTLITSSYQTYIVIESTCSTDPCAPQSSVTIPPAMPITTTPTTAAPTIKPTTPATVKPTTAPVTTAPTVKPTTAPVTVKPTTAPGTVKPTTAPVTTAPTVKPTTAPTTVKPTTSPTTVKPTTAPATVKPTTAPGTSTATPKATTKPGNVTGTPKPSANNPGTGVPSDDNTTALNPNASSEFDAIKENGSATVYPTLIFILVALAFFM